MGIRFFHLLVVLVAAAAGCSREPETAAPAATEPAPAARGDACRSRRRSAR